VFPRLHVSCRRIAVSSDHWNRSPKLAIMPATPAAARSDRRRSRWSPCRGWGVYSALGDDRELNRQTRSGVRTSTDYVGRLRFQATSTTATDPSSCSAAAAPAAAPAAATAAAAAPAARGASAAATGGPEAGISMVALHARRAAIPNAAESATVLVGCAPGNLPVAHSLGFGLGGGGSRLRL
jgi:hypothetical protein